MFATIIVGIFCVFSVFNISCFAEEFCDDGVCVNEGYIFERIIYFALFFTFGTLIICCPCITYKYCCLRRNRGVVYSTTTGVAVNLSTNFQPYPQQQFQQPITYPLYGIPPPEYTPTAQVITLPPPGLQTAPR